MRKAFILLICLTICVGTAVAQKMPPVIKDHHSDIKSLAFTPDGKTLIVGYEDELIKTYDVATGKSKQTLKGQKGRVTFLLVAPDGRTLASGTNGGNLPRPVRGEVILWDLTNGKQISILKGFAETLMSLAFTSDSKKLAIGSSTRGANNLSSQVALYNVATGRAAKTLGSHSCQLNIPGTVGVHGQALAASPDGKTLAIGSIPGGGIQTDLHLWDQQKMQPKSQKSIGNYARVSAMRFSADGSRLAITCDNRTVIWNIAASKAITTINASSYDFARFITITADGKSLIGAGPKGAHRWSMTTGKAEASHPMKCELAALSQDGSTLAVVDNRTIKIFNLAQLLK